MATKQPKKAQKKRCSRCGELKAADSANFPRNAALADGLGAYCRPCKRESDREQRHPKAAKGSEKPQAQAPKILATGGKRGPRSSITAELVDDLCARLRLGHSRRVAARVAGVNEDTLASWMMRGRDSKDSDMATRQLYDAVIDAEGEGLRSLEEKALAGAEIDPMQALRLLERRSPEDWGRKDALSVTGGEGKPVEVQVVRELLSKRLDALGFRPPAAPTSPSPGPTEPGAAPAAPGGPP